MEIVNDMGINKRIWRNLKKWEDWELRFMREIWKVSDITN